VIVFHAVNVSTTRRRVDLSCVAINTPLDGKDSNALQLRPKCSEQRRPGISPWIYSPDILTPGHFLFRYQYPEIYNIKRSTVSVYKIDSGGSVRVRSTGILHTFVLSAGGNVPGGEENCPVVGNVQESTSEGN